MLSRRDLVAALSAIAAAAQQARSTGKFEFFTPDQARDAEAIAEQIIPRDESPGAKEAGVMYFIDRALSRYFQDQQAVYRKGLAELLLNAGLHKMGGLWGQSDFSLNTILGFLFSGFAWAMGVPSHEMQTAGSLMGLKLVANEFVAYSQLKDILTVLSPKTVAIVSFALCGFANFRPDEVHRAGR